MTPTHRTPQQRDRRFARVRRITQTVLLGSGVVSAVLVGYVASAAKPVAKVTVTVPAAPVTTPAVTTPANVTSGSSTYTPPTTAPVTSTTVCTTTPSGTVTCY